VTPSRVSTCFTRLEVEIRDGSCRGRQRRASAREVLSGSVEVEMRIVLDDFGNDRRGMPWPAGV